MLTNHKATKLYGASGKADPVASPAQISDEPERCEHCGQPKNNGWRHGYTSGYGDFATVSCSSASEADSKPARSRMEPVEAVSTTHKELPTLDNSAPFNVVIDDEGVRQMVHNPNCTTPPLGGTPLPQQEHGCIGKVTPKMVDTGRLPNYDDCTQGEARQGEEYAKVIMAGGYEGDTRDAIATLFACHLAYRRLATPALPQPMKFHDCGDEMCNTCGKCKGCEGCECPSLPQQEDPSVCSVCDNCKNEAKR
jgi:hypothetical protein